MLHHFNHLSPLIIAAIFICGFGGTFQYGFSISVMSCPSVFIKELVNTTCQQRYSVYLESWQLSLIWSFIISVFCIGGLLGFLLARPLMSKFGRKKCLLLNNFVAIAGAALMVLSRTAVSFEMIIVGRFLYGINAGVGVPAHTAYLLECSPKRLRGAVGVTPTVFLSTGVLTGQILSIRELLGTEDRWHWLLAVNGFAAVFQLLTLPLLPDSPEFLFQELHDRQACEKALMRLLGKVDISKEVEEMLEEKAVVQGIRARSVGELFLNRGVRWQLLTIVVAFITLQFSGINAMGFYSCELFRMVGIQEENLGYVIMGSGLSQLCSSLTTFVIIERTGKKTLMFRGYMAMAATLLLLTITTYLQTQLSWMPYCSAVLVFFYAFFFFIGPAGVTAPLPGELLNQSFKAAGYTVACNLSWLGLFVLGMLFPMLLDHIKYFCFLIFFVFCFGCALFVWANVPETKNLTVPQIAEEFQRMHNKQAKAQTAESIEEIPGHIPEMAVIETIF